MFQFLIHNVNQNLEINTSEISNLIILGEFDLSESKNIIIGNVLARNLNVTIGDELQLTNYNNSFKETKFILKGIFDSGIHEYNQRFIYRR